MQKRIRHTTSSGKRGLTQAEVCRNGAPQTCLSLLSASLGLESRAIPRLAAAAIIAIVGFATPAHGQTAQQVYEKVFGDAARLDPAIHEQVKTGEPGKRHYIDKDNDGKPDEVWFIDQALRHPGKWRPILVRVIDEDGDLEQGAEPDLDSDLYVADWKADGAIDVMTDYTDRDGDNDVDEMAFYFPGGSKGKGEDTIRVWWGDDLGDDNLLWFDIGYTYNQGACQYRCHFGGDELFCAYAIGLEHSEWECFFENPFLFYDLDNDGVTEQVVRVEGRNEDLHKLRYSYDVDNDATPDQPRDFDISISAHPPRGATIDEALMERRELRGLRTGPFLRHDAAPKYCQERDWAITMLTWDENDINIDGRSYQDGKFADTQERWEGIIAAGTEGFPQIGGPHCGEYNERYELRTSPQTGLHVYYAPTDHRIHLLGAERMWLAVDLDYDHAPDMRYDYADTNGDGHIDTWTFDADMDGQPDDTWTGGPEGRKDLPYTWEALNQTMAPVMASLPQQLLHLDIRLRQALAECGAKTKDPVWAFLQSGLDSPHLDEEVRLRLLESNENWRFLLGVLKDRLIIALRAAHPDAAFWKQFGALRTNGDFPAMKRLLEETFDLTTPLPTLAEARAAILIKYAKPQVAWAEDWIPPNIGWESELAGYRAYWGQFDFFGKKHECLVMSTFGAKYNYHAEQDWGMDTLHIGPNCGLGGVTLYVDGKPYPVWSPEGKGTIEWSKRLVSQTDDEVTIELLAANAGPAEAPCTVRFQASALADCKYSPITVAIEGVAADTPVEIGVNLQKLPHEDFARDDHAGIIANWGYQDHIIGAIGMGIIYPKDRLIRHAEVEGHHQVVLKPDAGRKVTYLIQGDWLRGRRFPNCPTIDNWMKDLRRTAKSRPL